MSVDPLTRMPSVMTRAPPDGRYRSAGWSSWWVRPTLRPTDRSITVELAADGEPAVACGTTRRRKPAMIGPTDPPPGGEDPDHGTADAHPTVNPWVLVEDRIRNGHYDVATAMLERLRPRITDPEDLAYLDERLAHIAELQARHDAWLADYMSRPSPPYERFPGKLATSLYAVVIASAILIVRTVLHESPAWAVFAVTVLAPPALVVTSISAWTTLNNALPLPLRQAIAAFSAGYLGYVAYRFGVSLTLICVGAFSVGLFVTLYPMYLVSTAWHSRGGRFDHL
jgi:hypothetical protein